MPSASIGQCDGQEKERQNRRDLVAPFDHDGIGLQAEGNPPMRKRRDAGLPPRCHDDEGDDASPAHQLEVGSWRHAEDADAAYAAALGELGNARSGPEQEVHVVRR
jgi:hypothetical protein